MWGRKKKNICSYERYLFHGFFNLQCPIGSHPELTRTLLIQCFSLFLSKFTRKTFSLLLYYFGEVTVKLADQLQWYKLSLMGVGGVHRNKRTLQYYSTGVSALRAYFLGEFLPRCYFKKLPYEKVSLSQRNSTKHVFQPIQIFGTLGGHVSKSEEPLNALLWVGIVQPTGKTGVYLCVL